MRPVSEADIPSFSPGFLHVYEEMEKAQAAMVRLMIKAKEAAGPSGSLGSHCPRLVRAKTVYFLGELIFPLI